MLSALYMPIFSCSVPKFQGDRRSEGSTVQLLNTSSKILCIKYTYQVQMKLSIIFTKMFLLTNIRNGHKLYVIKFYIRLMYL